MKLMECLTIFCFIAVISVPVATDDGTYMSLVKLVADFRNTYSAYNVFIARSESTEDLQVSTAFVALLKWFSQRNVFAMFTRITDIPKDMFYYNKQVDRPFFVIIIRTMTDFYDFSNVTKTINMNLYTSLILFTRNLMDLCKNPTGNPFNLVLSSQMFIKCQDFPIMREWYSLDSNNTEIGDLFSWKLEDGFKPLTNLTLYERRDSLKGIQLRVTFVKDSDLQIRNAKGLFGHVLKEISEATNLKVQIVSIEETHGSYNIKTKLWTGMLGKLQSNQVDMAVSEVTMTKDRLDALDFSCPLILSRSKLFIKDPGNFGVEWNAYLKAFNRYTWISILVLIILSSCLLTYIKLQKSNSSYFKYYLIENYLNVWGIYCQQGLSEICNSSSLRVAYVSISFSSIIIFAIYSASIISYLTVFTPRLPFDSLASFVKDHSYKLTIVRDSAEFELFANPEQPIIEQMSKMLKKQEDLPSSYEEAFEQTCQERVAYYANGAMERKVGDKISCKLVGIRTGSVDNLAFALTKDNPFTDFISYHILRLQGNGVMQRLKKMYFRKRDQPQSNYEALGLLGIAPIITILFFGFILSIFILIFEKVYYELKNYEYNKTVDSEVCLQNSCGTVKRTKEQLTNKLI